jgi:adenylosuccinate lyase
LTTDDVDSVVADPLSFTGAATAQVRTFLERVADVASRYPDAVGYVPEPIL